MKYILRRLTPWAMTIFISMLLVTVPCNAAQSLDAQTAKIVSGIEA
ncbi:MAG TPA: outer membrane lipoprotein carrier protein LolA, partial [Desulfobacter sp.]|nr:outer membrane lipoprotein carrier protein LolA [Desulfobacter sp.]